MRTWKHQKGVTLLELVIGLVLFGIIAWGFTGAIIPSLKNMTQRSEAPEDWLHEARSEAEKIIQEYGTGGVSDCDNLCNKIECIYNTPDDDTCKVTIPSPENAEYKGIVLLLPIE